MYNEIKNDLITLPMQVYKAEEELVKKDQLIKEKDFIADNLKQTIIDEVINELEGEKKKYTNEKMRASEIKARLGLSLDYKKEVEESTVLKSEVANGKIYISFLKRRFIAAESLTRM